jgi:hypothetical protein
VHRVDARSFVLTDNGTWYALACGPRGAGAEVLPFRQWKNLYKEGYSDYDEAIVNTYAAQLAERAEDMDGAASYAGGLAQVAADSWFKRDTIDNPDEEAANFMYQSCRIMRQSDLGAEKDIGPGYSWGTPGTLGYIAGMLPRIPRRHPGFKFLTRLSMLFRRIPLRLLQAPEASRIRRQWPRGPRLPLRNCCL